jgi:hypothetical protein
MLTIAAAMRHAALATAALLAASCAFAADDPTDFSNLVPNNTVEQSLDSLNAQNDPCKYAARKDIEAIVGAPMAIPPFRSVADRPEPQGTECRYLFKDFHAFSIVVSRQAGDKLFEALTGVNTTLDRKLETPGNLNKILPLEGEWDEVRATSDGGLVAIRGDSLVSVTLAGLALPREKVADLVNAIYRNLDHPLAVDGAAGVAAARDFDKTRPSPRPPCSLITRAAAEAALGPLLGPPSETAKDCALSFHGPRSALMLGYVVKWRNVYSEYAMLRGVLTAAPKAAANNGEKPFDVLDAAAGPWEKGFQNGVLFVFIRHDVMLEISAPGVPVETVDKIAAAIVTQF